MNSPTRTGNFLNSSYNALFHDGFPGFLLYRDTECTTVLSNHILTLLVVTQTTSLAVSKTTLTCDTNFIKNLQNHLQFWWFTRRTHRNHRKPLYYSLLHTHTHIHTHKYLLKSATERGAYSMVQESSQDSVQFSCVESIYFSNKVWQYALECCQPGKLHESVCPEFLLGLKHIELIDQPSEWLTLVNIASKRPSWYHVAQNFHHRSHCLDRLFGVADSPQTKKDILTGCGITKAYRLPLRSHEQRPDLSLDKVMTYWTVAFWNYSFIHPTHIWGLLWSLKLFPEVYSNKKDSSPASKVPIASGFCTNHS